MTVGRPGYAPATVGAYEPGWRGCEDGYMPSTVADNPSASRFEIRVDGQLAGAAEYQRDATTVSFTHTAIDAAYEGRGLGSALVRGALEAVRAEGRGVLPFCSFVRGYLARHPEYLELVPTDQRARFALPSAGSDR